MGVIQKDISQFNIGWLEKTHGSIPKIMVLISDKDHYFWYRSVDLFFSSHPMLSISNDFFQIIVTWDIFFE